MASDGFNLLDTRVIDRFIAERAALIEEYNAINAEYANIVADLCDKWKGKGAKAFKEDSENITKNMAQLGDILQTVCDMAADIREIFAECDTELGNSNRTII